MHTCKLANLKKQHMYYRNHVTPNERLGLPCQTPNLQFPAVRSLHCHSLAFGFLGEAELWVKRDFLQDIVLLKGDLLKLRGFRQKVTHVLPSDSVPFVLSQELICPRVSQRVICNIGVVFAIAQ